MSARKISARLYLLYAALSQQSATLQGAGYRDTAARLAELADEARSIMSEVETLRTVHVPDGSDEADNG